jgi:CheY-like chemotaxis protein/anti-sigma regulatory factor (Ser/Thr protein kinase)
MWIEGDSTRVCQIISNLLQNAAKFSEADGLVHVRLDQHDGRARLTVRDTGMGMEPATIARLFQPFNQADNSLARSRGGLGLGLALVRGLVELHGGTVRAESPGLGKGSTITVELPLTELRPAGPGGAAPKSAPQRRIVIIEDNADAALTLAHLLRRRGHEVFTAAHGTEGLALVQAHRAEVLLCDIGLPGELDGYAVARAVRAVMPPIPILMIALTGYGREQDQQRATEAGFTYHLTKPIAFEELDSLLASWKF